MHLNIASLNAHKDELDDLLSILNLKLDIIALSETKILKGINPTYDPRLRGYNEFLKPTESEKGGTALYINENIQNTQRTDLETLLYFPKLLESSFAELVTSSKEKIIVGCIYKHPKMDIDDFNTLFEAVMDKITKERKEIYLLGDFNIDLLKVDDEVHGQKIDEYYNI